MRYFLVVIALIGLLSAAPATYGQTGATKAGISAKILLRALAFDRSLGQRVGERLTIAVLFDPARPDSLDAKREMVAAFAPLASSKLGGLSLRVIEIEVDRDLVAAFRAEKVGAVYVPRALEAKYSKIRDVCRQLKIASLAEGRGAAEGGLSIAVEIEDGHPKLVVNLEASRAEGLDLSARMLALAEVVRGSGH